MPTIKILSRFPDIGSMIPISRYLGQKIQNFCGLSPNKRRVLNQDFNLLISTSISGQTSCSLVARVAKHTSWRRLWDIALDKGVKGSRTLQRLFKELSRPKSVFTCTQCASDSEEINEPSCFEHACEQHSDLIGDLTCSSLIDCLIQANSDSIFNSCMYMSNCTSLWSFVFLNVPFILI